MPNKLECKSFEQAEFLPAHFLKLIWLNQRKYEIASDYRDLINHVMEEVKPDFDKGQLTTTRDNVETVEQIYEVVRSLSKGA